MKASEHLTAARALIDTPAKWTQNAWARDEHGRSVAWDDTNAVSRCAWGALRQIEWVTWAARQCFATVVGDQLDDWNDNPSRRHADVMAAFDAAIAQALADIAEAFAEADRIENEARAKADAEHAEWERAA